MDQQPPLPLATADRPPEPEAPRAFAMPAWMISAIAHAVILAVFAAIVFVTTRPPEDQVVLKPAQLPAVAKKDPPPETKHRPIDERSIDLDVSEKEPSPFTQLTTDDEPPQDQSDDPDDRKAGDPAAIADMQLSLSPGVSMVIGVGSDAASIFGDRGRGYRKRKTGSGPSGATRESDGAIEAALRWFKRHQSPDGKWDVDGYVLNCEANPKCEPGTEHTDHQGDVACTAYAVLCYLGVGFDQRMPSRYRTTVRKGIDWLLSVQKPDGLLGERNYEHAVAAMALVEAYAMSNDARLREPAQKAVDVIRARQLKGADGYPLAWDYVQPKPERIDASVSGWNVMALKSAAAAGLSVGDALEGADRWLQRAWEAANPEHAKIDPYGTSRFPYTWNSVTNAVDVGAPGSGHKEMAPVGALCAVFLHHKAGDPMLETLVNYAMQHQFPTAYPCNTYYLYYNTLAMYQVAGERWERWNGTVRDLLVHAQRATNDCFDGSWDSAGTIFHGNATGRLLSTAYCCLSLEVYYRYYQTQELQRKVEGKPAKQADPFARQRGAL